MAWKTQSGPARPRTSHWRVIPAIALAPELAYTLEIERIRTRVGGSDELSPLAIRRTTVFRRKDGTWKVTHRHGDPIMSMRSAESVLPS
jgi:ketosteroid isomerase-like protein